MSSPVVSSRTPVGQIINRDGTATFAFLKWMQNIGTTINITFDSEGEFQGAIGDQATIDGRETLASIVQNISTDGVVQGPGIDFALPYLNKDTDHIADGTGSPLSGGKEAYAALVASGPTAGQTIRFDGTDWLPVAIAVSKVLVVSQWLRSYDAATGTFTASQPVFSDVSGVATKTQLPASIAYEDEANTFAANQTINGDLAVTGNETVGGNLGVTGNISAANFPGPSSMVYPAAGIGVSTGSAWTTSIDPATVPRTNTANTFSGTTNFGANVVMTPGTALSTLIIDPPAGSNLNLNWDTGTGVVFGNGSGAQVVGVDTSGNIHTIGHVSADNGVNIGSSPGPPVVASTLRLVNNGGTSYLDLVGPNAATQGIGHIRTMSSDISLVADVVQITSAGIAVTGNFSTSGTKAFLVTHPLDDTKDLIHACLEGPENGVFYRGEVETVEGLAQVVLPDYFEALTFLEDRSVLLTQIEDGVADFTMMRASRIQDGKFSIRTSEPSAKIAWEVKAVRRIGVERLQVMQAKQEPIVPVPTPLPEKPKAEPAT